MDFLLFSYLKENSFEIISNYSNEGTFLQLNRRGKVR